MDFKVAYTTDKNNITTALANGKINSGDLILVLDNNNNEYGELVIVDANNHQVNISGQVRKFANLQLANAWLSDKKNPQVGEFVSILTDGKYVLYTINESGGTYSLDTATSSSGSIAWVPM